MEVCLRIGFVCLYVERYCMFELSLTLKRCLGAGFRSVYKLNVINTEGEDESLKPLFFACFPNIEF